MNQTAGDLGHVSIPGNQLFPAIEKILKDGATFKLVVTGDSMRPFLYHHRDSVILRGLDDSKLKRGDIVLIHRDNDRYVLHRVRKLLPNYFIMHGDAQVWTEQVRYDQVIATASNILRKGKTISCDSRSYRILSGLWMLFWPLRSLMLISVGIPARVCRKVASVLKLHKK